MNIKTTLKTSVAAAALFAIAAPVSSPANAEIKNGNKNTLTVSGQVIRAMWYGSDGEHDSLFVTEGDTAHSRVRWVATGTLNENVTAGAVIEMDIPLSNEANQANFNVTGTDSGATSGDNANWSIRQEYVWVAHKKFGKVSLGQTDAAANGNMQASLSGAGGLHTMNNVWTGGGIRFLDKSNVAKPKGSFTTVTPATIMSDMDFSSRNDVIKYDTPSIMGLVLSVSYEDDGTPEVGARYSGKFGPVAVVGRLGYNNQNMSSTTIDSQIGGSLAVRHDSGLNAAFSMGTTDLQAAGAKTRRNVFGLLGYNAKIFKVGGTAFAATYARTSDNIQAGDRGTAWGLQAQQDFDAIGASVSLVYRNYDYENKRVGHTNIDSIDVFGLQAAFNF